MTIILYILYKLITFFFLLFKIENKYNKSTNHLTTSWIDQKR